MLTFYDFGEVDVPLTYLYEFTAEGATAADSYWQNATNSGTAGTAYTAPTALAGYTFTASGTCLEVDPNGSLGSFAANVPALTSGGFVSRQAYTNIALRSQEFNSPTWGKINATATSNTMMAPDGSATGDTISVTATGVGGVNQTLSGTASTTYTASGFFKYDNSQWAYIQVNATGVIKAFAVTFDIQNGVVGNTITLISGLTVLSAQIVDAGLDWYRCSVTYTLASDSTGQAIYFAPTDTDSDRTATAGKKIKAWGGQLASGLSAGPYMPTTTATVTRGESLLTTNIFVDGSALVDQDMLVFARGTPDEALSGIDQTLLQLDDGTNNNRVSLRVSSAQYQLEVVSAGVSILATASGTVVVGDEVTIVARRSGGNWRAGFYKGGVLTWLYADAAGAFPAGMTKALVGNRTSGGFAFRGTVHDARITPGAFATDAKVIAAITAP